MRTNIDIDDKRMIKVGNGAVTDRTLLPPHRGFAGWVVGRTMRRNFSEFGRCKRADSTLTGNSRARP